MATAHRSGLVRSVDLTQGEGCDLAYLGEVLVPYRVEGGHPRRLEDGSSLFAGFQMVAEFLMGLGLLVGGLTPLAGAGATLFFFNLFLTYFGGNEWIWTYVLLTVSALVVTITLAGRQFGLDQYLLHKRGQPPIRFLW